VLNNNNPTNIRTVMHNAGITIFLRLIIVLLSIKTGDYDYQKLTTNCINFCFPGCQIR
jgi:hypothetical protein